jgi:hypothetical protein
MNVCGKEIIVQGRLVRIARLAHERFEFLENPEPALMYLREAGKGIDLFTFMQKLPHMSPEYSYPIEWDNVAAVPVSTFEHWWTRQIDGKTRNMVRRAEKKGIVVREIPFDDALVCGVWEIYNECPVRQGRVFPHYGKDVETVRKISATFPETSTFIGAFLGEKLIGFVKLTCDDARSMAMVMHILALVQHRDKAPTNALVAEAVRYCATQGIPYLVYSKFSYGAKQRDSLSDFKESNGFERIDLPRYYVPLTRIGAVAFRLGLHHSFLDYVPEPVLTKLRELRSAWHNRKPPSLTAHS